MTNDQFKRRLTDIFSNDEPDRRQTKNRTQRSRRYTDIDQPEFGNRGTRWKRSHDARRSKNITTTITVRCGSVDNEVMGRLCCSLAITRGPSDDDKARFTHTRHETTRDPNRSSKECFVGINLF